MIIIGRHPCDLNDRRLSRRTVISLFVSDGRFRITFIAIIMSNVIRSFGTRLVSAAVTEISRSVIQQRGSISSRRPSRRFELRFFRDDRNIIIYTGSVGYVVRFQLLINSPRQFHNRNIFNGPNHRGAVKLYVSSKMKIVY